MFRKFKCAHCGKFTLHRGHTFTGQNGKVSSRLCKPCSVEDDAAWDWHRQQQAAEEAAAEQAWQDDCHMQDILDGFCNHYGCWGELGWCYKHDLCPNCGQFIGDCRGTCQLDEPEDDYDDEDDYVSSTEAYSRAYAHFGNPEMAREAAEMYPGDFI